MAASVAGSVPESLSLSLADSDDPRPLRHHDPQLLAARWCQCLSTVRWCWQSGLRASDLEALERRQRSEWVLADDSASGMSLQSVPSVPSSYHWGGDAASRPLSAMSDAAQSVEPVAR